MRVVLCALMYYANIRAKLMCVILPMLAFDKQPHDDQRRAIHGFVIRFSQDALTR